MNTTFISLIGWPLIIFTSIFFFFKGRRVYKLVKGSMVGQITEVLVYSLLVNISCLGMVSTFYIVAKPDGIYLVLMVFVIWFAVFVWSLRTINKVGKQAEQITGIRRFSQK